MPVNRFEKLFRVIAIACLICARARADVGDPQLRTDHPFYPGELAFSTFDKLFSSEADQWRRVTGEIPATDEAKALAAWFWRNTHYAHGEEGAEDLWGQGFGKGGDTRTREYWTGLFAHGFGLCGTTHSQWTAEMEYLLGHGRARGMGVEGHNSFEVFLKGDAYGEGRWALLDHDLSTVIFDAGGKRLLAIPEVKADLRRWIDRSFAPEKQHGWLVCGLDARDGAVYSQYNTAEYLAGYAGPPPIVHLRRGEKLRRYFEPGLDDGKTFVFWGRNYNTAGIPGPERSITWVNQPEKMHGSKTGAGYHEGQARYANAVYTYTPDFRNGDYREGLIDEKTNRVIFEFYTPYIIGATPANAKDWGIYDAGGKNGLVIHGSAKCDVEVSVDQGTTWQNGGKLDGELDLTDFVKGRRQYWIRFGAGVEGLAGSGLTMRTVCQAAIGILPRLKDDGTKVTFATSDRAIISAGPNLPQAKAHVVNGGFNSPEVTLEIATPRGEEALEIFGAAHIASGNPPAADIRYQIEYSIDAGKTWQPIVKDWTIPRRGEEPPDFWSQSLCYGSATMPAGTSRALIRFRNSGRKNYLRAEAHLIYRTRAHDRTRVAFNWRDSGGERSEAKLMDSDDWTILTGQSVRTHWVEMENAGR